ncbi:APC family permease [Pseudonocardia sp. TMWB2A]|uniref:APC family permease n=1 Tax=Pseudonocardia sp. TMWB2A TaxID=687430 RepID=UPI00307F7D65
MADPGHSLRGSIGVAGIVFLVVAAAAPLTTVGGALPVMLAGSNGAGVPLAYALVAVVLLLFSVGYAAMSHFVVDAGAFYAYVSHGLGARLGLGAGGLALLAYTAIQAAVYGLAAVTLRGIVVQFGGPELPWWLLAALLVAVVALLGYRSIDVGAKVLGTLLVVEIAVVTALVAGILVTGGPEGWSATSFAPSTFLSGAPGIAVMFAVASFVGFEATAIYAEEAREPRRTVPIATYVAVLFIGAFYTVASWAVVVAFGPSRVEAAAQADPTGLVFAAAATYVGPWFADVLPVLLLTSLFAALLAFHNAVARYLFSLGRRGALPTVLSRTHPRHGSPHVGSLVQTVSAVLVLALFAVAGGDPVTTLFPWMSGLATVAVLVLMLLTAVAVLVFFARTRADTRTWNTRVAPTLGLLGIAGILSLVLVNFTTLIGGSAGLAGVLLALVVVVLVGGVVLGGARRAAVAPEPARDDPALH